MHSVEGVVVSDSPHAQQLQRGVRSLRFEAALEADFRAEYAEQNLRRQRTGFLVASGLYLLFLLVRVVTESGTAADLSFWLRAAMISALMLTVVVSYTTWNRYQHIIVFCTYVLFAVGITSIEVVAEHFGVDRHYEGLIFITVHAYVFSGLVFRQAFSAASCIFLIYLVGGWFGGLAGQAWGYELLFIVLLNLLGAASTFQVECIARENYLTRHLLREMIGRDGMTGLHNRTAFLEHFQRALAQAARDQRHIAILMLDFDEFKAYNDNYGHLAGDNVLREVGQSVRGEFRRPMDLFARYAGEEFVGIWYDIDPAALDAMAERVRKNVESLNIPHEAALHQRMTVSVGVVVLRPTGSESLLDIIARADQALYAAKHSGRNRVVIEQIPDPNPTGGQVLSVA